MGVRSYHPPYISSQGCPPQRKPFQSCNPLSGSPRPVAHPGWGTLLKTPMEQQRKALTFQHGWHLGSPIHAQLPAAVRRDFSPAIFKASYLSWAFLGMKTCFAFLFSHSHSCSFCCSLTMDLNHFCDILESFVY